jgi:rhodanese-related sulfurtransferase
MSPADAAAQPPHITEPITAQVTVSGAIADILRDLAAIDGRTPEEMVQERVAGRVVIPAGPASAEDWELFDGPADLSARSDEYLRGGFGQ